MLWVLARVLLSCSPGWVGALRTLSPWKSLPNVIWRLNVFYQSRKSSLYVWALLSSAGNWSKSEIPLAGSWLSLFYCRLLFFLSFITTEPTLCNSLWFQPYVTLAEGYGSSGLMGLEASREGWGWYPTDKELVLSLSHMQLLLFLALPKVYRPWEGEGGDARAVGVGSGSIA